MRGVDLEALIDSACFAPIKDLIQDSTGDELIRRIKDVHPDLDLSFLTGGVVDSPDAADKGVETDTGGELKTNEPEVERAPLNSTADVGSN